VLVVVVLVVIVVVLGHTPILAPTPLEHGLGLERARDEAP